jgi:hypothetical protein
MAGEGDRALQTAGQGRQYRDGAVGGREPAVYGVEEEPKERMLLLVHCVLSEQRETLGQRSDSVARAVKRHGVGREARSCL